MTTATMIEPRLRGAALRLRLLPVLASAGAAAWALRSRLTRAGDAVAYTSLMVEAVVLGAGLLVVLLRTRVRLLPAGVEVRELRTRTYAWTDIAWVAPTYRYRGVRLGFRDGSARTLPAPRRLATGGADRGPDQGIDSAVLLLRRQAEGRS